MSHNLRDRCSEYIAGSFTATVGASVQLAGAIQRPFVGQTYKTAYGTSTGDVINTLPINIDQGVNWQSGYAKFDHDTNSIEIQSISASSSGGTAVAFTAAATISIVMLADIPFASAFKFRPTGSNDHLLIAEAQADLRAEGAGRIVLMQGDWDIRAGMQILPGIHIAGEGKGRTNLIIPSGLGDFTLFDFNSSTGGFGSDQHHWGLSHLTIDGENASISTRAVLTKSSVYSMKNVTIESIVVSGFGKDDTTVVSEEVLAIRDPEGLVIHNSDFLDFGNRVGVRVRRKDSTPAIGASIFTNRFVRIRGESLTFDHLQQSRATFNEFSTPADTSKGLVVYNSSYNNIALNQFTTGLGIALIVTGTSNGNQLLGNVGQSNGEVGTVGIEITSTCEDTSVLAGSFIGYETDLNDSSPTTYVASLATTAGIVHKPEPEPIPDPVVIPPIPPFVIFGLGMLNTGSPYRVFDINEQALRITVFLHNFSTNGIADPLLRLVTGLDGARVTITTGYDATSMLLANTVGVAAGGTTNGFPLYRKSKWATSIVTQGKITLYRQDVIGHRWFADGRFSTNTDKIAFISGNVELSEALTQIVLYSTDGIDITSNTSILQE